MPTPRYKIRPDTGDLQEYLFEYNGILALKNFVARVDGERLILHSGADMNFSILDALVSEVEIDGRVYDNAEAAQEALMRLTFNTNRPVLMTQQERELLQGALQRGTYVGTAADLKALIDGKVDKVPGKILSTNDFTNELRTKLEGLRNVDISGLLPKGGYTGTAQNLKELIDNIMRILQSSDTELDELREIVAYIKQNKRILDTLGIGNIAGLQAALNGKAPTDHNHDDRYSRLGHTHSEYAYRTHRHNWDDIDGKPALATEGKIQEAVSDVFQYRRVIPFSELNNITHKQGEYTILSTGGSGAYLMFYTAGSTSSIEILKKDWYAATRLSVRNTVDSSRFNEDNGDFRDLAWYGDVYRVGAEIGSNWAAVEQWQNGVIFVSTSLNIDLSFLKNMGNMSFRKVFAGGTVTFTCTGKTIIYTGDNAFNGGDGSTAVVSIYGNKCYIDIRNV
jgi:hypothetical protein